MNLDSGDLVGVDSRRYTKYGMVDTRTALRVQGGKEKVVVPETSLGQEVADFRNYLAYLIDTSVHATDAETNPNEKHRKARSNRRLFEIGDMVRVVCQGKRVSSLADLQAQLVVYEQEVTQKLREAEKSDDQKKIAQFERDQKVVIQVQEQISRFDRAILNLRPYQEWLTQKQGSKKRGQPIDGGTTASNSESKGATVTEQQRREQQLMAEILTHGSVSVHLSTPALEKGRKIGFQDYVDGRRLSNLKDAGDAANFFGLYDRNMTPNYDINRIREFTGVFPLTVSVNTQTRLVHRDFVTNGKDEPLAALVYCTKILNDDTGDLSYPVEDGRPGNSLIVSLLLPDSLARSALEAIKKHPEFVRTIVEQLITTQTPITREMWLGAHAQTTQPLRPPYEAWDDAGEQMYIKDNLDYEFQRQSVYPVQKIR